MRQVLPGRALQTLVFATGVALLLLANVVALDVLDHG
jgi:hypothetical protein